MFKRFGLAVLIFGSVILPVTGQQAQQVPTEFVFRVTAAELETIGKALESQPFKDVAVLMGKLRQQVVEQQKPKPSEVPAEPKKE